MKPRVRKIGGAKAKAKLKALEVREDLVSGDGCDDEELDPQQAQRQCCRYLC